MKEEVRFIPPIGGQLEKLFPLTGKVAIVTGVVGGIGAALVGAKVALCDIRLES